MMQSDSAVTSAEPVQQTLAQAIRHQQHAEYAQAENLYRRVLETQPQQPDALHYMGLLAHQTGRAAVAHDLLAQSLALAPGNAGFQYNYAGVLSGEQRFAEAIPYYQRALELQSSYAEAWHGLALALHALGHPEDAVACWQRGLRVAPRYRDAWQALADTQQSLGLLPEAVVACRQALALSPDDPAIRTRLASLLIESGALDEADRMLDSVLVEHPDSPEAHYQKGVLLTNLGKFPGACERFETALRLAPDFHQASVHLVAIRRVAPTDPLARRLQAAARRGTWSDPGQGVNVHFTLAKIHQDNGDYDRAFEHYREGNRLRRQTLHYSSEAQRRFFDALKRVCGGDFIARKHAAGSISDAPIFIVGMPRSGTSLVEQILASHPQVQGGGELMLLHSALRRRLGADYRLNFAVGLAGLGDADLRGLAEECLAGMHALAPQAKHITDKMPSNFMILGLVHMLYPRARIIYCRRDPLDTCVSCFTTLFKSGHEFCSDLRDLGVFYRLHEELMQHWKSLLPPETMLDLQYEQLVEDPEGQSRRLTAHCGLVWDPACLAFDRSARVVTTASVYQVRQPVYRSAVGRWRHYASHLGPLREALHDAGPLPAG